MCLLNMDEEFHEASHVLLNLSTLQAVPCWQSNHQPAIPGYMRSPWQRAVDPKWPSQFYHYSAV